jgi:predicted AAA+ superfamily ATPase
MLLLPRLLAGPVERALRDFPVVAVLGARQTGKTTLAREIARRRGMTSVTLDDPRVLEAVARDPDGFLAATPRPLLIDEAQRAPDLFRAMKLVVDAARRPGTFLLTGSANYLLMQSVSESLAGRVALFDLNPLAWPEWRGVREPVILDRLLRARSAAEAMRLVSGRAGPPEAALRERIIRGGLPVPGAMRSTDARAAWFSAYVQTYLERDLRDLARVASLPDFHRLLRLAALRTGRILSYADLARDADLSPATARAYLNLAAVAYFVRLLPPYLPNRTKRLVKSPKVMLLDSGLAAHLAGATTWADVERADLTGQLVETWVHGQLAALLARTPRIEGVFYWRTQAGAEVDFVVSAGRRLLPVEVKWTTAPGPSALRGIEAFLGEHADRAPFGVVLHRAREPAVLRERVIGLPVTAAFE